MCKKCQAFIKGVGCFFITHRNELKYNIKLTGKCPLFELKENK